MLSIATYLFSLIIILGMTTTLFFVAQFKKNNSIIDVAYGLIFIITAILLTMRRLHMGNLSPASVVILVLIIIWGIRLARRIHRKNKGKGEDFRYQAWRKEWSRKGVIYYLARTYLQVFILQGFVISLVLLPFTLSLSRISNANSLLLVGVAIWALGFYFESRGDKQLDAFIKSKNPNKGTIMKTGLWKYTRHPNYFGESTMWIGIACIALSCGASNTVLISPLLITYLLLFVSGIPMLEKKWEGVPEWEVYKAKTSAFIPMIPKK